MNTHNDVRDAMAFEVNALARLWYDAWQDAHANIVPAELVRARTPSNFHTRMASMLPRVRVIGAPGEPLGFHYVQHDELVQLFVAAQSRGSGVAKALIADAERQLRDRGITTAWLACAIGNHRAARFYEKCGWSYVGPMFNRLDLDGREYLLEVWRYEKTL